MSRELYDEIRWGSDLWVARREDAVTEFRLDAQRLAQATPLVRGSHPARHDRGNTTGTLTISVLREHATEAHARAFLSSHYRDIAALDQTTARDLLVRYLSSLLSEYTYPTALLTTFPGAQLGQTTRHTYTFTVGDIT
jgi:hypothetical protein